MIPILVIIVLVVIIVVGAFDFHTLNEKLHDATNKLGLRDQQIISQSEKIQEQSKNIVSLCERVKKLSAYVESGARIIEGASHRIENEVKLKEMAFKDLVTARAKVSQLKDKLKIYGAERRKAKS